MHELDLVRFLAEVLLILAGAKLLGELAERLGQPAVLGELAAGIVLGMGLFPFFRANDRALALMSEAGVIMLLFETGLHSDRGRLLKAGPTAAAVALAGVAAPFLLGWGLMLALGRPGLEAVFVGAALTATSVGITARVLYDLGKLELPEAQIVLGAAVLDDVVGLIILSAVQGAALAGALQWAEILKATAMSAAFLAAALLLGPYAARALVKLARGMRVRGALGALAVGFALALALAAHALGTAMLVGAFTAGLLLARTEEKEAIDRSVRPIVDLLTPVFFVMVGARVDLTLSRDMLGLTALLILAAVAGKLVSGLAARGRGLNRLAIGAGMIPRGEVGLIFAQMGLAAGIIEPSMYGALVTTVIATTFVAPPLLKKSLS